MDWEKPSSELGGVLDAALGPFALVERRMMFGGPTYFLNGHMFAGVHGRKIVLRLDEADRAEAKDRTGALQFEPAPGRVMREYIVVAEQVWSDPDALEEWLRRSVEYVGALPPKEPKPKKKPSARRSPS